jgi:hypothetical protein
MLPMAVLIGALLEASSTQVRTAYLQRYSAGAGLWLASIGGRSPGFSAADNVVNDLKTAFSNRDQARIRNRVTRLSTRTLHDAVRRFDRPLPRRRRVC